MVANEIGDIEMLSRGDFLLLKQQYTNFLLSNRTPQNMKTYLKYQFPIRSVAEAEVWSGFVKIKRPGVLPIL